jgi:hypothetical protein
MKMLAAIAAFSLIIFQAHAQNEPPKGFKNGKLVLTNNTTMTGYVKDNIRGNASVTFLGEGDKKKTFDGSALNAAEIDGVKFLCVKGDFFKIISEGDLYFLQKESDASRKASYNGTEAVFMDGTEGSKGDYFIYDSRNKQLKLVTKKTFDAVVAGTFASNTSAIDKANAARNDIAQLKAAVDLYNNH